MPFFVIKGDLVEMEVDCIVNASNVNLSMVEGVGRAIYHKAGNIELATACKKIGGCDVGDAVCTPPFGISNTKLLIHAVGPNYINGKHNEEKNLRSAYQRSFEICLEHGFKSIAFPLLSGEFNYPLKECYRVGQDAILNFLKDNSDLDVYMVMFKNFPEMLNEEKQNDLTTYILNNLNYKFKIETPKKSFIELLKERIKECGSSNKEIAFNANIKESYLIEILKNPDIEISKDTIIGLGFAFHLNKKEVNELLNAKSYFFDGSVIKDMIACYLLDNDVYSIFELNKILFSYGLDPIGLK